MNIPVVFNGLPADPVEAPSDREVLDAVATLLRSSRRLGKVQVVREDQVDAITAENGNRALIVHSERAVTRAEPTPGRKLRVVPYRIVVQGLVAADQDADAELGRRIATIHNLLDNVEYTSYCLFEYCFVLDDSRDTTTPPTIFAGLTGQFAYVTDQATGMRGTR